ncbi:MAG: proteasome subunit beta [Candidatus Bathyarchaeota archaeon]|nr:proteasome subunit beta [Candidatus Bathyarchaeota archaeon]
MAGMDLNRMKMMGTTTVALKCVDGVVMVSDTRAVLLPGFIASKAAKKIYRITRNTGMTIAGLPADAQNLLDLLRANASIYQLHRKRIIPVRSVAGLASNILFSQRYFPYIIQVIIGGYDTEGYHIFSLDPLGSVIEDNLVSTGSGSPVAYGVLENEYKDGVDLDSGLPIAVRAISAAMKRNVYTGDDFNAATITEKDGYVELTKEQKKELLSKAAS